VASVLERAYDGETTFERFKLEIISTLLRRIGIPPPKVYKDRQSNWRVGVFLIRPRNSWWTEVHHFLQSGNVCSLKSSVFRLLISHRFGELGEEVAKKSENHEIWANFGLPNFNGVSPPKF